MSQYYPPQQPSQQQPGWPQQPPTYYPPSQQPRQQQPPFTGYPQWTQTPPPPFLPPQPPRKKKPKKTVLIVLGVMVALIVLSCISFSVLLAIGSQLSNQQTNTTNQSSVTQAAQQQPTQAQATPTSIPPTPTPTHAPKWVTVQSFSGNGTKKTAYFTVPNDWKLVWKCNPASFYGGSYNVIVSVTGSDGTPIDPTAVNTICSTSNTGDSTDEHQGGRIYLDVISEGSWTLQVQELK